MSKVIYREYNRFIVTAIINDENEVLITIRYRNIDYTKEIVFVTGIVDGKLGWEREKESVLEVIEKWLDNCIDLIKQNEDDINIIVGNFVIYDKTKMEEYIDKLLKD